MFLILASKAQALDASYFRLQSSSSQTNKIQLAQKINSNHRLAVAYSSSKDTSGTLSDDAANYFKLSYRYRPSSSWSVALEGKVFNDYYDYTGQTGAVKTSIRILNWGEEENQLATRLNLRAESQQKKYSKMNKEEFSVRALSLGIDQDFSSQLSAGLEATSYDYQAVGVNSAAVLNNRTSNVTDIDSYSSSFLKSSVALYVEYNLDLLSFGVSRSQDSAKFSSGSNSVSSEVYADFHFWEAYTFSLSVTQGSSESSASRSQTWGLGIGAEF